MTISQDRYLTLSTRCHRQPETTDLSRNPAASSGTNVSSQTAYRRITERALNARRPVVCLPLNIPYKKVRMSWSLSHHSWTHQEEKRVFFLCFSTQSDSGRVFIWRESWAHYLFDMVRKSDHFGTEESLPRATWCWVVVHHYTTLMWVVSAHSAVRMGLLKLMWGFSEFCRSEIPFLWTIMQGHTDLTLLMILWNRRMFALWTDPRSLRILIQYSMFGMI